MKEKGSQRASPLLFSRGQSRHPPTKSGFFATYFVKLLFTKRQIQKGFFAMRTTVSTLKGKTIGFAASGGLDS